jgi:hypothetical protein
MEIGANERPSSDAGRRLHRIRLPKTGAVEFGESAQVGYGESTPMLTSGT